jgi:hypothetical protein
MIWLSVFDLVRRWPAPAEQGAAIRLPWLTDSLRDAYEKRGRSVKKFGRGESASRNHD